MKDRGIAADQKKWKKNAEKIIGDGHTYERVL
jgi:hypothetical protein